jgi:hypothetical protein
MNYGNKEMNSPNANRLFFGEFSSVKVLVLAERRLQDAEV